MQHKSKKSDDFADRDNQIVSAWIRRMEQRINRISPVWGPLVSVDQFIILLITLVVALLATDLYVGYLYMAPFPALVLIMFAPISVPMFPSGLIAFFKRGHESSAFMSISLIALWAPYLVIFLTGTLIKNRMVFIFIYLCFIALLLMNIIGCGQVAPEMMSGYN